MVAARSSNRPDESFIVDSGFLFYFLFLSLAAAAAAVASFCCVAAHAHMQTPRGAVGALLQTTAPFSGRGIFRLLRGVARFVPNGIAAVGTY